MALLVSIQPSSILNKTANYMRVSVVRYDLKATDCLARFDLLDSTGDFEEEELIVYFLLLFIYFFN